MKQTLSNGRITSEMRFSLGLGDKLSSVYVFALKVPYYTNVSFCSPDSSGVTLHTENIFDLRKARCLALCLQPPLNTLGVSLLLDLFALTPPILKGRKTISQQGGVGKRTPTSGKGIRELPVPFVTSQKTDLRDGVFFLAHSS